MSRSRSRSPRKKSPRKSPKKFPRKPLKDITNIHIVKSNLSPRKEMVCLLSPLKKKTKSPRKKSPRKKSPVALLKFLSKLR